MSDLNFNTFQTDYLSFISADLPGFAHNMARFTSDSLINSLYTVSDKLIDNAKKFNLTSILEPREIIRKHLIDSLIPLGLLLGEAIPMHTILDVGTGAGFPLLPWACALSGDNIQLTGLDATAKKITHIRETAAACGLRNLTAIQGRAEEVASTDLRETFSLVTARAVSDLPVLMELCAGFVSVGGYFASLKGRADVEIEAAKNAATVLGLELVKSIAYEIPGGDCRTLVIYRKNRPTPGKYPRRYAEITKNPL